jgi:hypothetical protein
VRTHSVADGINAVRMVLPRCYFDAAKCAKGIHALRHYRREWNEAAQAWRATPVHDHASHGADSMRYLALGVREAGGVAPAPVAPSVQRDPILTGQWDLVTTPNGRPITSWMGV